MPTVLRAALLIAALFVFGSLSLALVLLPLRAKSLFMLYLAQNDCADLEHTARSYLLLRRFGLLRLPLIVVYDGISESCRTLTEAVCALDPAIVLLDLPGLQTQIAQANEKDNHTE